MSGAFAWFLQLQLHNCSVHVAEFENLSVFHGNGAVARRLVGGRLGRLGWTRALSVLLGVRPSEVVKYLTIRRNKGGGPKHVRGGIADSVISSREALLVDEGYAVWILQASGQGSIDVHDRLGRELMLLLSRHKRLITTKIGGDDRAVVTAHERAITIGTVSTRNIVSRGLAATGTVLGSGLRATMDDTRTVCPVLWSRLRRARVTTKWRGVGSAELVEAVQRHVVSAATISIQVHIACSQGRRRLARRRHLWVCISRHLAHLNALLVETILIEVICVVELVRTRHLAEPTRVRAETELLKSVEVRHAMQKHAALLRKVTLASPHPVSAEDLLAQNTRSSRIVALGCVSRSTWSLQLVLSSSWLRMKLGSSRGGRRSIGALASSRMNTFLHQINTSRSQSG
jgi:hypothetical protein